MIETYKPSGRFSPIFFAYVVGAAAIIIGLAWLYVRLLHWIPLIYISFLITLGFMGLCFIALNWAGRSGNCRNLLLATVLGLLIGAGAVGTKHWFQYKHRLNLAVNSVAKQHGDEAAKSARKLLEATITFKEYIKDRLQTGWSVGRVGRSASSRAPAKGLFVWLVWALEAGMIILGCVAGLRTIAGEPFSESSGQWADEERLLLAYNIPEHVPVYEDVETLDDLLDFPEATDHSPRSLRYILKSVPGDDEEDSFLSVVNRHVSYDKEGKENKSDSTLFENVVVTAAQRADLLERLSEADA